MATAATTWKPYKIVFRLLSSLHIGHKKMKNIQYTRRYIPGKTVWGALTSEIARKKKNYAEVGNTLKKNLRFSYFFLSENEALNEAMLPRYDDSFKFGNYDKNEFERKFLDSYISTAISPHYNSAEEESLHEVEILTHLTKDNGQPVYLIGYIFEKTDKCAENHNWQKFLEHIRIGGERKYGFGRVKLVSSNPDDTKKIFGNIKLNLNSEEPSINLNQENPFPGHVQYNENNNIIGETEVLVFRETSVNNKYGSNVTEPILTYCPGCINFEGCLCFSENFILK